MRARRHVDGLGGAAVDALRVGERLGVRQQRVELGHVEVGQPGCGLARLRIVGSPVHKVNSAAPFSTKLSAYGETDRRCSRRSFA